MYRCMDCGRRFEAPAYYREQQGEHHGMPVCEVSLGCPSCGGEYEEIISPASIIEGLIRIKGQYDMELADRDIINDACNMLEGL